MELEHAFQQSNAFIAFQFMVIVSFLFPGMAGRNDIYRRFMRALTSYVVSFTPVGMLLFLLYKVGRFQ
jgi:hypothetical protein